MSLESGTTDERLDPYSQVAILSGCDFELRGSGLAVPLRFKPDGAFILTVILGQPEEFTRDVIVKDPNFKSVCEGVYPPGRFAGVFSDIRFTFDALGSTLIQTLYQRGTTNVYRRNPEYTVFDECLLA